MYSEYSQASGVLLTKRDKTYVDISLSFEPSPLNQDLTTLRDTRAINNALKNIVMTYPLEMPFNPNVGSEVTQLLFDPVDEATAGLLEMEIRAAIQANEPRVEIVDVIVVPNVSAAEDTILQKKAYSLRYNEKEYFNSVGADNNYQRKYTRTPNAEAIHEAIASQGAFTVNITYKIVGSEQIYEVQQILTPTR